MSHGNARGYRKTALLLTTGSAVSCTFARQGLLSSIEDALR